MMKSKFCIVALLVVGIALMSQGCGSGGDDPTTPSPTKSGAPTTTPASTSTGTTTSGSPPRKDDMTKPLSVDAVVKKLNGLFKGYVPDDVTSTLGVTMSWLKDTDDKMNVYCPSVAGSDSHECFDGTSSCRMSAIIHNKNLPVVGGKTYTFSDRRVSVVFRQELVENFFGKCAYMYDGATNNRYNYGCGVPGRADCSNPNSPYSNICPSTNKTCTTSDPMVEGGSCDHAGGHASVDNPGCFYKGAAYDISEKDIFTHYNGKTMWVQNESSIQLRTMVDDRNNYQKTYNCEANAGMCWNEIIIDERLLLAQLWWDPATVVDAFVFKRGDDTAKKIATTLQQSFQRDWDVSPPVIAIDANCNVAEEACAPFYPPEEELAI